MARIVSIDLNYVKKDIYRGIAECNKRGLIHSAKWLAGMSHGLQTTKKVAPRQDSTVGIADDEFDDYIFARTLFDVQEYDRSAYFTRNCKSAVPHFLYLYAIYMSKQKKKLDNLTDTNIMSSSSSVEDLGELLTTLRERYEQRSMDAYMLYLYGVVLKKLDLNEMAVKILLQSIHAEPVLWSSWVELVPLIADRHRLANLNLPVHWITNIFIADAYVDLKMNAEALQTYEKLQICGLKSVYIQSQIAVACSNDRNVDWAIQIFKKLQKLDPYRLDAIDIYSHALHVREMRPEMAVLAHTAMEINKYRPETMMVVGNYYSLRHEPEKAVTYFQRALKLNPNHLAAWTLMGLEFMELKNPNAAIQSYRKVIEMNRRDYQAWYGLGQAYEILKMRYYSIYYYKMAHYLRPHDSRILVALGMSYHKIKRYENAVKCYHKACSVGDIEGAARLHLADLHMSMSDVENAVDAYLSYCEDEKYIVDKSSLRRAYRTLCNYYESINNHERAAYFAYKCMEDDETKAEGLSLLKSLENHRANTQSNPVPSTSRQSEASTSGTQARSSDAMVIDP